MTRSAQLIQAYIDRRRQASFIVCQDITSAPHRSLDCLVGGHHKDPIYGGTAFQCRDRIEEEGQCQLRAHGVRPGLESTLARRQGSDRNYDRVAIRLCCTQSTVVVVVCRRACVVVRSRAGRPIPSAMARSSATVFSEPCSEPAIREIVSSISVPPRSLAPPLSIHLRSGDAKFDPAGLDVGYAAVQHDACQRVRSAVVPIGRPWP